MLVSISISDCIIVMIISSNNNFRINRSRSRREGLDMYRGKMLYLLGELVKNPIDNERK